jgi:hypothetical protein
MLRHKVTVVLASSLAGVLSVFGVSLASSAAADGHGGGQGSVVSVRGADAGNGDSFNGGVNAGPSSEATAIGGGGGRGGSGGNGGDVHGGRGHGGHGGSNEERSGWGGGSGSHGGRGGSAGAGGSGGDTGAVSGARGGANAASQSSVNHSGNSANTNVTSGNVQVNPEIRSTNKSANVAVSSNDNDNDNDNRNDADADAGAAAVNLNGNVNVGVNDVDNSNTDRNSNTSSNTGTNTNSGSNTGSNTNSGSQGPPPLSGQALCESYGGTFSAVNGPDVVWVCDDLPTLEDGPFDARNTALFDACLADGGTTTSLAFDPPQAVSCLTFI